MSDMKRREFISLLGGVRLKRWVPAAFTRRSGSIVAQADGRPIQPNSLSHEWVRQIGKTGLPRIRYHDLRHAHATHLLSSGVHPKVASERLGHSKVGITLDLYSHALPGMQAVAAARVHAALQAAIQNRPKK